MKVIDSFSEGYDFLSNFYISPFRFGGLKYNTVEHFFQSMKAEVQVNHEEVRLAKTPGQAKKLGRQISCRKDWDEIKDHVMEVALRLKFQNKDLRNKLLSTGSTELIEGNWWGDKYWGVCQDEGQNKLGKLLMKIRDELRGLDKF